MTSNGGGVSHTSVPSEWVRLNVGGTVFTTTKSTLQKDRDSFLVSADMRETQLYLSYILVHLGLELSMADI